MPDSNVSKTADAQTLTVMCNPVGRKNATEKFGDHP